MVASLDVAVMCTSRARLSIISLRIRRSATVCMHALQRRLQRVRHARRCRSRMLGSVLQGMARDKRMAKEARANRLTERVSVDACADVFRWASCGKSF
jgi:type IV secretory pathway VirJ component